MYINIGFKFALNLVSFISLLMFFVWKYETGAFDQSVIFDHILHRVVFANCARFCLKCTEFPLCMFVYEKYNEINYNLFYVGKSIRSQCRKQFCFRTLPEVVLFHETDNELMAMFCKLSMLALLVCRPLFQRYGTQHLFTIS